MNIWLWSSEEEYKKQVRPLTSDGQAAVINREFDTAFQHLHTLFSALFVLNENKETLKTFDKHQSDPQGVYDCMHDIICAAEELFASCRPLAFTEAGHRFILHKHTIQNFEHYTKQGGLPIHVVRLVRHIEALEKEFDRLMQTNEPLLIEGLRLPEDLRSDFVTARNLISIGFDEAGVIYAGRGLEGVVRRIAKDHNVMVGPKPGHEARFADILKRLEELRFASDKARMIEPDTALLLNYGRTIRNNVAHPPKRAKTEKYREQAILMAHKAEELWARCSVPGTKLI